MNQKELSHFWEQKLAEHGLSPIEQGSVIPPQEFTPPKSNSREAQSRVRAALSECLLTKHAADLSPLDLFIASRYSEGASVRRIANELAEKGSPRHWSNVGRRIKRIIAFFASKARV